jgi:putative flippase GtrA
MPGFLTDSLASLLRRLVKYGSVSVIATATALTVLGLLVGVLRFPAIWANVIATTVGTVPSFELNRRWVWAHRCRRSLLRQATPYFLLSLAGLVISTFAVHLASDATTTASRLWHTAAVEMANVAAYGALWIIQFVLCDRILFRSPNDASEPAGRPDSPMLVTPEHVNGMPVPALPGTSVALTVTQ